MFNLRGKYLVLAGFVAVVAVGWSLLWVGVRSTVNDVIETEITNARDRGLTIECPDRSLAGWPFRLELSCSALTLQDRHGALVELAGIRTVALAYNPGHVIVEAEAPARLTGGAGFPVAEAAWDTARASTQLAVDGAETLDVVFSGLDVSTDALIGAMSLQVDAGEIHFRENPNSNKDLDYAFSFDGIAAGGDAQPVNGALVGRLEAGAALLKPAAPFNPAGAAIHVDSLMLESGSVRIAASGTLKISGTGTLSGDLPMKVAGINDLAQTLQPLFPAGSPMPSALQGAVLAFGTPIEEGERVEVPIRIDSGIARIGLVPIGAVPQLF